MWLFNKVLSCKRLNRWETETDRGGGRRQKVRKIEWIFLTLIFWATPYSFRWRKEFRTLSMMCNFTYLVIVFRSFSPHSRSSSPCFYFILIRRVYIFVSYLPAVKFTVYFQSIANFPVFSYYLIWQSIRACLLFHL